MKISQRIATHFWFQEGAEQAAAYYCALFPNSRITDTMHYGDGRVMSLVFELDGQEFMALNGGPHYQLTPATSLFVKCDSQDEIDRLWDALLKDGGSAQRCGWLTDRFGLSWQIVPTALQTLLKGGDEAAAGRVMSALMQMVKLDLPALRRAYAG